MAEIFREVSEDLRHDRLLKIWRRFRYWFIGGVIAIIGAVAAYVVIDGLAESRRQAEGDRFASALAELEAGRRDSAADRFAALSADSDSGYAAIAGLRAADVLLAEGDVDGAIALYDQLAGDSRLEPLYRDLATLLAAEQLVDRVSIDEINQRLSALLVESNIWRQLALEVRGVAELRAGHTDTARDIVAQLTNDAQAPPGVRARAGELLDSLGGAPALPASPESPEAPEQTPEEGDR